MVGGIGGVGDIRGIRDICDIEVAILRQLECGRSDEFISRSLGVSTRTLRRYLAGMCAKLGVVTRFQLGAAAARLGLLGAVDTPDT